MDLHGGATSSKLRAMFAVVLLVVCAGAGSPSRPTGTPRAELPCHAARRQVYSCRGSMHPLSLRALI